MGFSQNDSTRKKGSLCMNTTIRTTGYVFNTPRLQSYYQPLPYLSVNLLSNSINSKYQDKDSRKNGFLCILIAGIAFTTAAIIEGGSHYGTYVNSTPSTLGTSPTSTYVTPPVYQQTPRNVMFCVGIVFTTVGIVGMANNK